MVHQHDYRTCQDGESCQECREHQKQEQLLALLKTRRLAPARKAAALELLAKQLAEDRPG